MEYIDGRNLAELHANSPMPPEDAAELVQKIAMGMQHAHNNGMIHGDLKPANVVMRAHDQQPKIIDFGLARVRHAFAAEAKNLSHGGTIAFMPPEQASWIKNYAKGDSAEDPTDKRTDVFALGAIFVLFVDRKSALSI